MRLPSSVRPGLWLAPILIALCAGGASAQDSDNSINLHHTYLPGDDQGFYTVEGARTLSGGEVYLALDYNHAHNPLELGFPGDSRSRSVVRQLQMMDATIGVGILDGLSVSLTLPIVLDNDGKRDLRSNFAGDTDSSGVGALRASLKWTFFDTRPADDPHGLRPFADDEGSGRQGEEGGSEQEEERLVELALSFKPFVTIPTGREVDYLSDQGNPTGGGMVQVEVEILRRLRLGTSFGVELISSSIDIGDLEIEDRFRFGVASEFLILRARGEVVRREAPPKPTREAIAEQRRAYRALAIVAEIGGTLPAERALLDEFASQVGLDEEARAALSRALDPAALEAMDPLADSREQIRVAEALHQLVYADGGLDPREQAACDLLSPDELVDFSQAPVGTWHARFRVRDPLPPTPEPVVEEGSPHTLGLGAELTGWVDTGAPFHNERERVMEVGGYLRYSHQGLGLNLRAGVMGGLTNGVGAPDVRYLLGIGWSF